MQRAVKIVRQSDISHDHVTQFEELDTISGIRSDCMLDICSTDWGVMDEATHAAECRIKMGPNVV